MQDDYALSLQCLTCGVKRTFKARSANDLFQQITEASWQTTQRHLEGDYIGGYCKVCWYNMKTATP